MASTDLTPDTLQEQVTALFQQADAAGPATLTTLADLHQEQAQRLTDAATRLAAALGPQHADVVALQAAAREVTRVQGVIQQTPHTLCPPQLRPQEWMVFGQVQDTAGQPLAGLRVRLVDPEHRTVSTLKDTATDANGEFTLVYDVRDFAAGTDTGPAKLPTLHVQVADAQGKVLHTSQDSVQVAAGRSEYFAFVLPPASARQANTQSYTSNPAG